jgi:hypothetical protein
MLQGPIILMIGAELVPEMLIFNQLTQLIAQKDFSHKMRHNSFYGGQRLTKATGSPLMSVSELHKFHAKPTVIIPDSYISKPYSHVQEG